MPFRGFRPFPMAMTPIEILGDLRTITVDETRRVDADYAELVIPAAGWPECWKRLRAALGDPVKPLDQKPTAEQDKRASPWGGVRKNQILFEAQVDGRPLVCLIWPWEGGERYTVKLARPAA